MVSLLPYTYESYEANVFEMQVTLIAVPLRFVAFLNLTKKKNNKRTIGRLKVCQYYNNAIKLPHTHTKQAEQLKIKQLCYAITSIAALALFIRFFSFRLHSDLLIRSPWPYLKFVVSLHMTYHLNTKTQDANSFAKRALAAGVLLYKLRMYMICSSILGVTTLLSF